MKDKKCKRNIKRQHRQDIDPITLAILIFAGISAVGALAGIGWKVWERKEKGEEISRQAESHLFEATRQLNRLRMYRKDLARYMARFEYMDASFAPGHAPIVEDALTTNQLRRLRREITEAGEEFSRRLEDLTIILGDTDKVEKVRSMVMELDKTFYAVRTAETYIDYFLEIDGFAGKVDEVLHKVADLYGIRLPKAE